jgi:hypothetical protein
MCFSPTVSFTAGAILMVVGIATLNKVTDKSEYPFALLPLLFAVQQFTEGMIWVVLEHGGADNFEYWLTQTYTFFAGMLWPLLVPFGALMLEKHPQRKAFLILTTILGAGFALYTLNGMFLVGVSAHIENLHIVYHHPWENNRVLAVYVITTCFPFFFSSNPRILQLGLLNIAAFFVAYYFYNFYLASVWCFFAALMSGGIYVFFIHEHRYQISLKKLLPS